MAIRPRKWLERRARERAQRYWDALSGSFEGLSAARMRNLREEALSLRASLDRFLLGSDRRVAQSRAALDALHLPGGTDWRWRPGFMAGQVSPRGIALPESGTHLGEHATIWHDSSEKALILEQISNSGATDLSPFGMRLEVFSFSGSFLSIALDLPEAALNGLTRSHILRLEVGLKVERPINIYARLNVGHGPNVEELLLQFPETEPGLKSQQVVEFDLAYTEMNEKRLEKIWLDLIFESPRMSAVEISELFMSRHMRAEF